MKTHVTITKEEIKPIKANILDRWIANYITMMTKALYPPEARNIDKDKDVHRIFYK